MPFSNKPRYINKKEHILADGTVKTYSYDWRRYYKGYKNVKYECECGSIVNRDKKTRHFRSKKHQKAMKELHEIMQII